MHLVQNSCCTWMRSPVVRWSCPVLLSYCLFELSVLKITLRFLILYYFQKCWNILKGSRELWDYYLRSITGMQRAQNQQRLGPLSWRWFVSDWLHILAKEITSVCTSTLEIPRGCAQNTLMCKSAGTQVQCPYFSTFFFFLKRMVTSKLLFGNGPLQMAISSLDQASAS